MPDYYIFHQNMRVYGGGNAERNEVFNDAMMEISSELDKDQVVVAGFTEIMNFGATVDALGVVAAHLDVNLRDPLFFACGITAFKNESPEYVAIAMHKNFSRQIGGRVLLTRPDPYSKPQWTCFSETDLGIQSIPKGIVPDSRGLAYVGGRFKNKYMIVGFMHNMYNLGDRSSAFQALSNMINLIWAEHSTWANTATIFGGDFNVDPRDITSSVHTIKAVDNNNNAIPTTKHHTYDFWISSANIPNGNAFVDQQTRNVGNGLSDHAGIRLLLPLNLL